MLFACGAIIFPLPFRSSSISSNSENDEPLRSKSRVSLPEAAKISTADKLMVNFLFLADFLISVTQIVSQASAVGNTPALTACPPPGSTLRRSPIKVCDFPVIEIPSVLSKLVKAPWTSEREIAVGVCQDSRDGVGVGACVAKAALIACSLRVHNSRNFEDLLKRITHILCYERSNMCNQLTEFRVTVDEHATNSAGGGSPERAQESTRAQVRLWTDSQKEEKLSLKDMKCWVVLVLLILKSSWVACIEAATITHYEYTGDMGNEGLSFVDSFPDENILFSRPSRSKEPMCGLVTGPKFKKCEQGFCAIREASRRDHPWHAAIFRDRNLYVCSGVLVRRDWVLSTATCVSGIAEKRLKVRIGSVSIRGLSDGDAWESPVADIISHPHFSPYYMQYDVAALRLLLPVDYENRPYVRPICLPFSARDFSRYDCVAAGWHASPSKEISETIHEDSMAFEPKLAHVPYSILNGYQLDEDGVSVTRKSYRKLLLEAAVKLTSEETCVYAAQVREERFISDGLRAGQGCLAGYEPENLCIPDAGSAVACLGTGNGLFMPEGGAYPTARPDVPCTPYPQLRMSQLLRAQRSHEEKPQYFLAGLTTFVAGCEVDDTRPPIAIFTDAKIVSEFIRDLIL
ncbi:unnamed protein product [Notodromas monacha]|uniref:Peptidase S1 domain-containing protein n=1 Tax=Notodromas monacha TaxID=399045 RepID=A0A7R9BCP6_9CRUS|nr:unnamed protein product [Notodromas monacha]CAG0912248.1 unnamed protein product [Notodromas monacha]